MSNLCFQWKDIGNHGVNGEHAIRKVTDIVIENVKKKIPNQNVTNIVMAVAGRKSTSTIVVVSFPVF